MDNDRTFKLGGVRLVHINCTVIIYDLYILFHRQIVFILTSNSKTHILQ